LRKLIITERNRSRGVTTHIPHIYIIILFYIFVGGICGSPFLSGVPDRNRETNKKKWQTKGQYIIYAEKENNSSYTVYSTNSPFWFWFFTDNEKHYKINKKVVE